MQDSSDFSRRSAKLNNYYESFRRDMISILGNVKLPDETATSASASVTAARGGGGYGGTVGADPSLTATNSVSGQLSLGERVDLKVMQISLHFLCSKLASKI